MTRVCRSRSTRRPRRVACAAKRGAGSVNRKTARTELLSEDAILFLEIVDDVALLLVDPPSNGDDEALQGLWKRKHTERAYQRWVATMKAAA